MAIVHLVSVLKNGGLAVIPTDTIYGIVAVARDRKAVARLYALRRKTPRKPFIVLIDSLDRLADFGVTTTGKQRRFLNAIWPGKVSVVLPCRRKHFLYLHRGTKTLAFRLPKSEALVSLIAQTGPLLAPSANLEGKPPATTIARAKEYFGEKVAYYSGRGRASERHPSTIISLATGKLKLIRLGREYKNALTRFHKIFG